MKKFYLLTKTLLAAALLCVGQTAWGESLIFTEDFADETYNVTWGGTSQGGISPAVNNGALKVANGSQTGDRSAYIAFGENAHTGCCRLTFDMAMTKSGTSGKNNNFYVLPSATTARYPSTTDAALIVTQDYNGAITIAGESVGTYNGTMLTYDLYLNTVTHYAKVIVKNGETTLKTISYATTATGINTLHLNFNKNYGAFAIDNISFYSLVAPAFTLSEDSKTVSVSGSETVNVTDITGTISVKSNNTAAATASYDAGVVTINGVANGVATVTVTGTNDGLTLDKNIEVTVGAVSTTTVTVNYLCGETPIADPLELTDVAVGSVLTASEVVYNEVIYGTGCRYVNPVLSESLPYIVVEDGVINITYTQQNSVASLNVKAQVGETKYNIKSESLTGKYIGDVITITYPRLWLVGTTLYSTAQQAHGGDYFRWAYTLDGNDAVIDYTTTVATDVVYYSEGEDIEGMTVDDSGNANIRCSDGKGGRSADELSLTTLGTGVYKLTSRVWGNSGCSYTYRAAGTDILTHATSGALNDNSVCFNVLSGTAAIKIQGSGTGNGKVVDYVYIQKLDDSSASIYNGDFENSTWDKGWLGTGSDKAKAFAKQTSSQTWGATGNFAEMWTDGSFSVEANLRQILVNVPAGNYILSADILNNVASSGGVLYAKVGSASDVTTAAESATGANESVSFTVAETSNVVLGFKTTALNSKSGWIAIDNFVLKQVVSGTITPAGWASFSSTLPLDLSTLTATSGATAYYASASGESSVTLTETTAKVPANTGLMIKGTAGETFTITATSDETTDLSASNLLKATDGSEIAKSPESGAGNYHYVFGYKKPAEVVTEYGFYNLASNTEVAAGKAYLEITKGETPARALRISLGGITEVENVEAVPEATVKKNGAYLENGKIAIYKNGMKFNANGQLIK